MSANEYECESECDSGNASPERIAIVGIGCRVPGATDAEGLWRIVREGSDAFTQLDEAELRAAGLSQAAIDDPRYVRRAPLLDDIESFDAAFFGLSAEQAELLDPQQRLFFECAWEALEDAGHPPGQFNGAIGVFGGSSISSYLLFNLLPALQPGASAATMLAMIGNEKDYLPTHLSYLLGLTGPSVGVQSACSTSLAAVHLACQSLLAGECDLALAGGASVRVPHRVGYIHEEGSILSPSGYCRSFDATADGTVFGSGAGVVALRRLDDALRDGDPIFALILGSAMNNDGNRKAGYTAPSVDGQAVVIAEALAVAGVAPESIGLIEAHGTGTPIGDPIEVKALGEVFRGQRGSITLTCAKANFGHLEAAAGIAGLIAATQALRHGEQPPVAHFQRPNLLLRLEQTPLGIARQVRPWKSAGPRRAGVSSFGIGGTNVHLVLEEAPASGAAKSNSASSAGGWTVLCASARSEAALAEAVHRLANALGDDADPAAVARSCTLGRHAFAYRVAVAARTLAAARTALLAAPLVHAADAPPELVLLCGQSDDAGGSGGSEGNTRHRAIQRQLADWGLPAGMLRHAQAIVAPDTLAGKALLTLDCRFDMIEAGDDTDLPRPLLVFPLDAATDVVSALMPALAALHAHGLSPDWRRVFGRGPRALLPHYPFQRRRHWRAPPKPRQEDAFPGTTLATPLADRMLCARLAAGSEDWLADHRIDGRIILPAAAFAALAVAAAEQGIADLSIERVLEIPPEGVSVHTVRDDASGSITIHARSGEAPWQRYASATIGSAGIDLAADPDADLVGIRQRCTRPLDHAALHERMRAGGIDLGPTLRRFTEVHCGTDEALARLRPADDLDEGLRVHPAIVDALFQTLAAILHGSGRAPHLPVSLNALHLAPGVSTASAGWCHARLRPPGPTGLVGDLALLDDDGRVLLRVDGLACRPAGSAEKAGSAPLSHALPRTPHHIYRPIWVRHEVAGAAPYLALRPPAPPERIDFDLAGHEASLADLDALCTAWVVRAFEELGARFWPGQVLNPGDALREESTQNSTQIPAQNFAQRFDRPLPHLLPRLLPRLWQMLAEDGIIDAARQVQRVPENDAQGLYETLRQRHPEMAPELDMLARCGAALADVLRGRVDPLALLFSGTGRDDAPTLYAESRYASALNRLACTLVAPLATAGSALNILEIGGGTGGATAHLLPLLATSANEYLFTDLSPAFLAAARTRFAEYDCLRTDRLDLERDPAAQGVAENTRHLVIAANVLHATKDLAATLGRVRRTLVPGGWLLLVEGLRPSRWLDLTFALTEGWWHGTDRQRRPDYPLLDASGWQQLLAEQGFDEVRIVTPGMGRLADQAVILARRALSTTQDHAPCLIVRDGLQANNADNTDNANNPAARVLDFLKGTGGTEGSADRLIVATRGGQHVRPWEEATPEQAAVAGLVRAAALERPACRVRVVDLDPLAEDAERHAEEVLAIEMALDDDEDSVAWRDGVRYVLRLSRPAAPDACPETFRLATDPENREGEFCLRPTQRSLPAPDSVEIRVVAAGLNFKDVLTHAALTGKIDNPSNHPSNSADDSANDCPLGGECAGIVSALGAGVSGLALGQRVVALAGGSFASHVCVPANRVAPLPDTLSFAQGAVLPISAMTALHALRELVTLRAGQRVLIHAATGGVGLHALALARAAGAEVFASAGSPSKRAWLKRQGVPHVLDSRSTAFAAQIRQITAGEGIDLVLNSLAGEAIAAGLGVLRPGGCFIEIGRTGIWSAEQVRQHFPQVDYRIVALDRIPEAEGSRLLRATLAAAERRELATPLITPFPMTRAGEAYRFMRQARHIGRIALTVPTPFAFRAERSYLITGGLGGLGLAVAQWALTRGARHLVLAGRTPPSPEVRETLAALRANAGAKIEVEILDVADAPAMERLAASFAGSRPPLAAVFHAAGTLDDAPLAAQDALRLARTRAAKLDAARLIARLFPGLEALVVFSSAAGLLGSAGQANHAAASAEVDAFVETLHAHGFPALSIDWGPWAEIGAAARSGVGERLAGSGMGEIAPDEGLEILGWALDGALDRIAALPIDWRVFGAATANPPPLFADLLAATGTPQNSQTRPQNRPQTRPEIPQPAEQKSNNPNHLAGTLAALAPPRRTAWLEARVAREAGQLIGGGVLPPERALTELGLDSLQAIELRNRLGALIGTSLPATLIFDYPSVRALAAHLLTLLQLSTPSATPPVGQGAPDIKPAPEKTALPEAPVAPRQSRTNEANDSNNLNDSNALKKPDDPDHADDLEALLRELEARHLKPEAP